MDIKVSADRYIIRKKIEITLSMLDKVASKKNVNRKGCWKPVTDELLAFVLYRAGISGKFYSKKDSEPANLELRSWILVKINVIELRDWKFLVYILCII